MYARVNHILYMCICKHACACLSQACHSLFHESEMLALDKRLISFSAASESFRKEKWSCCHHPKKPHETFPRFSPVFHLPQPFIGPINPRPTTPGFQPTTQGLISETAPMVELWMDLMDLWSSSYIPLCCNPPCNHSSDVDSHDSDSGQTVGQMKKKTKHGSGKKLCPSTCSLCKSPRCFFL